MKKKWYIIIAISLIIAIGGGIAIYEVNKPKTKKAEKNSKSIISEIDLKNENNYDGFKLLDSDIKNKDVILTGEVHTQAVNYQLKLKFLKYLSKQYNVKYYLMEGAYSTGQLLNLYLKRGDINILKSYMNLIRQSVFMYTNEEYNFWINLYNYNKILPENKKIRVIGIDCESTRSWEFMKILLPKEDPPNNIKDMINGIKKPTFKTIEQFIVYFSELNKSLKDYPDEYKSYLGENYFDFQLIASNVDKSKSILKIYASSSKKEFNNMSDVRNEIMYSTFVSVYNHIPKGKYYGQFGGQHVELQKMEQENKEDPFASKLNNLANSPLKGKVMSIDYCYRGYNDSNYENTLFKSSEDMKYTVFTKNTTLATPFNEKNK